MVIAFSSRSLRLICENQHRARRVLGAAKAEKLRSRLADMDSADNVAELIAGNPRPVPSIPLRITLDLCEGATMVFEANQKSCPTNEGAIEWNKVSRIKIITVQP